MVLSYRAIDLKSITNFEMIFSEMIKIENSKYYEKKINTSDDIPPPSFTIFTNPIKLRFEYNFSGNRDTNNIARPEWFLEYIKEIIKNSEDIVKTQIQPFFSQKPFDCFKSFIGVLYGLLESKINSIYDDENASSAIICHLVEEIIDFDKYMKDSYNYYNNELIGVTLNDKNKNKTLKSIKNIVIDLLQKKFDDPTIYNMDRRINGNNNKEINISSSPTPSNSSLVYMSLFNTLTLILSHCDNHEIEFYKTVIYPYFQEFINIMEKYTLKQLYFYKHSEDNSNFLPLILNVISSLSFIQNKLIELSDNPVYLKLSMEMDEKHIPVTDEFDDEDENSKDEKQQKSSYLNSLYSIWNSNNSSTSKSSTKRTLPASYMESEFGCFYREYSIIERMKANILEDMMKQIEKDISNSFHNYKNRSRQFDSLRESDILPVSIEFVEGLLCIKNLIKTLQNYCYKMLYDKLVRMIGDVLEKIIYNVAIEYNSYNINGGNQLSNDVASLIKLFPENVYGFDKLKEMVLLLTLESEKIEKLKRIFEDLKMEDKAKENDPTVIQLKDILTTFDVNHIKPIEVFNLIKKRKD